MRIPYKHSIPTGASPPHHFTFFAKIIGFLLDERKKNTKERNNNCLGKEIGRCRQRGGSCSMSFQLATPCREGA
jgi:hypothetical protein